jgi:hypothetical protein
MERGLITPSAAAALSRGSIAAVVSDDTKDFNLAEPLPSRSSCPACFALLSGKPKP